MLLTIVLGCSHHKFSNKEYQNTLAAYSNTTETVDPIADLRIYQIMVESFQNGDDSINYNIGLGPSDHKGDLQGVINALPYIRSLGMNAIWLTPIFEAEKLNTYPIPLDATAYYTRDYYKIDRHFGDEKKLEELVQKHIHLVFMYFLMVYSVTLKAILRTLPRAKSKSQNQTCAFFQKTFLYIIRNSA